MEASTLSLEPVIKRIDNLESNVETIVHTINDIYSKMSTLDKAMMVVDQRYIQEKKDHDTVHNLLEGQVKSLTEENVKLTKRVEVLEEEMKEMVHAMEMLAKLLR